MFLSSHPNIRTIYRLDLFINKVERQMASSSVVVRPDKLVSDDAISDTQVVQSVALPLHVQILQRALKLDRFINQVENVFQGVLTECNQSHPK